MSKRLENKLIILQNDRIMHEIIKDSNIYLQVVTRYMATSFWIWTSTNRDKTTEEWTRAKRMKIAKVRGQWSESENKPDLFWGLGLLALELGLTFKVPLQSEQSLWALLWVYRGF